MSPYYAGKVAGFRAPLARVLFALALATAGLWSATVASAQAGEVVKDVVGNKDFFVPEDSSGIDTGVDVKEGDRLVIGGGGRIKSGLALQDWVYPNGGAKSKNENLPLNQSSMYNETCPDWFSRKRCSPEFSLIGVFGGHPDYFLIGTAYDNVYSGPTRRLRLRINDDVPGNGEGMFTANVKLYRALPDADNDGVEDGKDNCPNTSNPGQGDQDFDGVGDACDTGGDTGGGGGTTPDEGWFRVTLNGFKVNEETRDHALEVDGKGDEVYLQAISRLVGMNGETLGASDDYESLVMGDTDKQPGRVQAGSRSATGGLKTGDAFPTTTPWVRSGPITNDPPEPGQEILPPFQLGRVKLVEGRNGFVVTPSVWEWDGGRSFFNTFVDVLAKHAPDASRLASFIAGKDEKFEDRLATNLETSLPALKGIIEGTAGVAENRPVGMADSGENYVFKPKSLMLNYDVAKQISETTFPHGKGVMAIQFQDSTRIGAGRYTVYLQVDRVDPPSGGGGGEADVDPPTTSITAGPEGVVASNAAAFRFSSSESGSTFTCSLDGAAFTACSSPKSYASLPDGVHTFQVRAKDRAGNVDPVGVVRSWRSDTRKPTVRTVTPGVGARGVAATANVVATFSEAMNRVTLGAATVTLKRKGTTTAIPAAVSSATGTNVVLNPRTSLRRGATYVATVNSRAKDKAGNPLDQNPRLSGNQPKVWTFTAR